MSGVVRVRADVFPATVRVTRGENTGVIERVRVIVTQDSIVVFQDAASAPDGSGVQVVFYDSLDDLPTANSAVTGTGATVEWDRERGCGCGSRLRAFNPYGSLVSMGSSRDRAS